MQDDRMIFAPTLSADAELVRAPDYAGWSKAAQAHDAKSGMQAWRDADESRHFDHKAIRARLEKLRKLSAAGDVKGLLFVLNEGITAISTAWGTSGCTRRRASARKS
jgi:TAG lipase/steryl ester hydrolase/phospholipase A2/LPA acyltransferase